jgi:hypothetical protein
MKKTRTKERGNGLKPEKSFPENGKIHGGNT